MSDKKKALQALKNATAALKKKFGDEVIVDTSTPKVFDVIPTGSAVLDDAIGLVGVSGWPRGRIIEVYGPESSGKSTICYCAIAQAQKKYPDELVLYVDAEHALDLQYAKQFGVNVNPDSLVLAQPESAEEALEIVDTYAKTGAFSLIILDSIAAMSTKAQLEKAMDEKTMGSLAGVLSPGLTKIKTSISETNTLFICVNQVRDSISLYGGGESTPGGRALKFLASIRLRVSKKDVIFDPNNKEKALGQELKLDFKKNKVGSPYRVVETKLIFGQGFDYEAEFVDIAISRGLIHKAGAWLSWTTSSGEQVKLQGKLNASLYFKNDPDEFLKFKQRVEEAQAQPITFDVLPEEDQDEDLD